MRYVSRGPERCGAQRSNASFHKWVVKKKEMTLIEHGSWELDLLEDDEVIHTQYKSRDG
jgi:hypothetical protein